MEDEVLDRPGVTPQIVLSVPSTVSPLDGEQTRSADMSRDAVR